MSLNLMYHFYLQMSTKIYFFEKNKSAPALERGERGCEAGVLFSRLLKSGPQRHTGPENAGRAGQAYRTPERSFIASPARISPATPGTKLTEAGAGRPAVLLCFVPASFEVLGMVLLAPRLLGVDVLDAAIMGAVVGAVSPAVIVPRMLRLMEEGYGADKGIPQMILAGASVDDVFVIVLFTSFTGMAQGGSFSLAALAGVPVSIVLGGAAGLGLGYVLAKCFTRFHLRDSAKVVVLLALAFLLVALEDAAEGVVPFSGLLAVLGTGLGLRRWRRPAAERLTAKFGKLWVAAEVMLFVLVGAEVDIGYAAAAGLAAVATVLGVLCFRAVGVLLCVAGSRLSGRERLFAVLAYLPKATVQAAIGGVPLAMGLACGQVVLTVAVVAILVTAPLGALAIDLSFRRLRRRDRG